ncbi:dynein intermediate chain 3, ciliary-like isoform X2 [Agrilus planipennis]|uniref:Dynein intermediate chain 3, ciliary-like isoform X2 n=1 Tax=Agrilus planipennis TaxID=224129 RepID=A0A7F5R9D2_AGRPL|nr:dynein intermediate chain 3, ciliary-like isoform X2 [Agrilus planipennis]
METTFSYQKKRCQFGRQCLFSDKGPDLIDDYPGHTQWMKDFILRDPVDKSTQNAPMQSKHCVNTFRAEFSTSSMNHVEGGWPKDINIQDEEATKRYRRKIEKDDAFNPTIFQLAKTMENCILQNNAINIYQQYFDDVEPAPLIEPSSARIVSVFQDQCPVKRPISHISWSPDNGTKLAMSHCNLTYQAVPKPNESSHSYIWEMENPNTPYLVLKPESPCACLEYNPKDGNLLISGQLDGRVVIWDIRRGSDPVDHSQIEVSHRYPVLNALWITSKSGCEFFSAAPDGKIIWWDMRKLNEPLEVLIVDLVEDRLQCLSNALGVSALEYEASIPTRFMIGCENGQIYSGNRKGKSTMEKLNVKFDAHLGPVLALQRNTAYLKNFLSIGDWTARVWAEDCRESSIMWTSYHKTMLTDGAWSPTRFSVFFTAREDGIMDIWDILQQQKRSVCCIKVCDVSLKCLRCHEMGRLLAVSNSAGSTYLVELSENLTTSTRNEKTLLNAMFERENKREKILEARNREIRLKLQQQQMTEQTAEGGEKRLMNRADDDFEAKWITPEVKQAEEEYMKIVNEELKKRNLKEKEN